MGKKINLEHVTLLKNHVLGNYLSFNKAQALTDAQKIIAKSNLSIEETKLATSITWSALKSLRDNSQLVAGQLYRITDYVTTSAQANTTSAGHPFDVIVIATDVNHLNEQAWAIQHEGDTYFANNKLDAWKIWYCLDNDTNKFKWADNSNGKGVIYRMIDEFNNDVPYDFKNIQFYRKWNANKQLWCDNGTSFNGVAAFTFSSKGNSSTTEFTDFSLTNNNNIRNNVIKIRYGEYDNILQYLNNNCFFGNYCYNNSIGYYCYNNSFGMKCYNNSFGRNCNSNSFGNSCYNNSFGNYCSSNSFGNSCYNNSFGTDCYNNSFGNSCYNNSVGSACYGNSIGNYCYNNSFGDYCYNNSFESDCYNNSFGMKCYNNSFGRNCNSISFGSACSSNSFGSACSSNSFGNSCYNNSFGNYCSSNSFGNYCYYISFKIAPDGLLATYFQNIIMENGVAYCNLYNEESASNNNLVKNYRIKSSMVGTSSAYINIEVSRNLAYDTTVAKNSAGVVKQYCEADLIQ